MTSPTDLMSITQLAVALTEAGDAVERSTLSRYVNNHGLVHERRGKSAYCSFAVVKRHRAGNFERELMGGAPVGQPDASSPSSAADVAATGDAPPASSPNVVPLEDVNSVRAKKSAQALQEQLKLAEQVGLVVERAEVEAGMAVAIGAFSRAVDRDVDDAADGILADLELPASVRPRLRLALKKFAHRARARLAEECSSLAVSLGQGPAQTDAAKRLSALIEHNRSLMPNPEDLVPTIFREEAQA